MTTKRKMAYGDFAVKGDPVVQGRTKLSANGRIVIPAALREALGLKPNDTLVMDVHEGALRVQTLQQRIRRVQGEVARMVPAGVSLADELIAERRVEARREQAEWNGERQTGSDSIRKAS